MHDIVTNSTSDALMIYDCCDAGVVGRIDETGVVTAVISACGCNENTFGPGPKSFTNSLIEILKSPPTNNFSARDLHAWTLNRLKSTKGTTATPVYTTLTQDGGREIFLSRK